MEIPNSTGVFYITHFLNTLFPKEGFALAVFYGQTDLYSSEYKFGRDESDPEFWNEEEMNQLVARGEVVLFSRQEVILPNQSLWCDPDGVFYIADSVDVQKNQRKIGIFYEDPVNKKKRILPIPI